MWWLQIKKHMQEAAMRPPLRYAYAITEGDRDIPGPANVCEFFNGTAPE
jgi:hypothetical protein